jgi:hypothetical protein
MIKLFIALLKLISALLSYYLKGNLSQIPSFTVSHILISIIVFQGEPLTPIHIGNLHSRYLSSIFLRGHWLSFKCYYGNYFAIANHPSFRSLSVVFTIGLTKYYFYFVDDPLSSKCIINKTYKLIYYLFDKALSAEWTFWFSFQPFSCALYVEVVVLVALEYEHLVSFFELIQTYSTLFQLAKYIINPIVILLWLI